MAVPPCPKSVIWAWAVRLGTAGTRTPRHCLHILGIISDFPAHCKYKSTIFARKGPYPRQRDNPRRVSLPVAEPAAGEGPDQTAARLSRQFLCQAEPGFPETKSLFRIPRSAGYETGSVAITIWTAARNLDSGAQFGQRPGRHGAVLRYRSDSACSPSRSSI